MAHPTLSVYAILVSSLDFAGRNAGAILGRIWLPVLGGCAVFYVCVLVYLAELTQFLAAPTRAHASFALAVTCIIGLVLLFIYAVTVAAVLDVKLGRFTSSRLIHLGEREYRLYAALLRFALTMGAAAMLALLVSQQVHRYLPALEGFADAGMAVLFIFVMVRLGFLLPIIAMANPRGMVLRRSWTLSNGIFWRLLAVAVVLALPGLALEFLGEFLGRVVHLFPVVKSAGTIQSHIILLKHIVPAFAILISVSVALILTLEAIASATVYGALTSDPGARGHAG